MPEGIPYASSNVTAGTGLELNYIGNHCYAYSGTFDAATSFADVLQFTTGKEYIVSIISCNGLVNPADTGPGTNSIFKIQLNGIVVAYVKVETSNESMPSLIPIEIIMPPYTNVTVSVISDQATTAKVGSVTLTGKLYG